VSSAGGLNRLREMGDRGVPVNETVLAQGITWRNSFIQP